jgi:hypothetical protein
LTYFCPKSDWSASDSAAKRAERDRAAAFLAKKAQNGQNGSKISENVPKMAENGSEMTENGSEIIENGSEIESSFGYVSFSFF